MFTYRYINSIKQSIILVVSLNLKVFHFIIFSPLALSVLDILEKQGLTEMLSLIKKSDLQKTLTTIKNFTIFAPTNEAIQVIGSLLHQFLSIEKKKKPCFNQMYFVLFC